LIFHDRTQKPEAHPTSAVKTQQASSIIERSIARLASRSFYFDRNREDTRIILSVDSTPVSSEFAMQRDRGSTM
jgi:hypothetical protein